MFTNLSLATSSFIIHAQHTHIDQYFPPILDVEVRISVSIPVNDVFNFIEEYLHWNKTHSHTQLYGLASSP